LAALRKIIAVNKAIQLLAQRKRWSEARELEGILETGYLDGSLEYD
jgi:hypothetical protein